MIAVINGVYTKINKNTNCKAKLFDLDDKEFARFLLYINGYIYDELTNLYFFSNELHTRNKRKYNEALQEYSNSLNRTLG